MSSIALTTASPRHVGRAPAGVVAGALVAGWLAAAPLAGLAADGTPAPVSPARTRVSDPAVRTAGGHGCPSCGSGVCRHTHAGHHGHHAGCRDGVCVPYCPVRPQQFGFYGTQWRRWPGSDVVQVSGTRDAGPVSPPRSAVPGPKEESMARDEDAAAAGEPGLSAGDASAAGPEPLFPDPPVRPEPAVEPETPDEPKAPAVPEPEAEMRREPPAEIQPEPTTLPAKPKPIPEEPTTPSPEPKPLPTEPKAPTTEPKPIPAEPAPLVPPAKPRPEDENLFEAVSGVGWRAHRRFAVGTAVAEGPLVPAAGSVAPVSHLEEPDPKRVPRVPFDQAAETRRVRAAR